MNRRILSTSVAKSVIAAAIAAACLMISIGTASGEVPPGCPADIAKYWRLDETGNPVSYADLLGGTSAACTICPTPSTGIIDKAQQFDGTTDLYVPYDGTLEWGAMASFSVEFWMKTDTSNTCAGGQAIAGRVDTATQLLWWVGCQEGGQAIFVLYGKDGTGMGITGTTALNDGNWHHIVMVRDGITNENLIYVDGIKENFAAIIYADGFDSAAAGLHIGWLNLGSGQNHFEGMVDELALYNAALSGEEISTHYFNGLAAIGYCDFAAPFIFSTAVTTGAAGQAYSYTVAATGNPAPSFGLTTSPSGMSINDATGLIEWTPSEGGFFDVTAWADNGIGTPATQSFTIEVSQAPAITSTPVTSATAGQAYSYTATASGNPAPSFSLTTFPAGMTINTTTGLIGWTPSAAGPFDVTVQADNGIGTPATQSFTVEVSQGPAITSTPVTTATAGQAYTYTVTATGNPAPSFSLTTFPAGMTINATTGLIEWIPSAAGPSDMTVQAENGVGTPATQSFTIVVGPAPAAPVITSTPVTAAAAGQAYSYTATATGNPAPSFSLTTFPAGMTIDSTTGLIGWTPSAAGPFDVTVRAENGVGTPATQSFTINVAGVPYCPSDMSHYWRLDETESPVSFADPLGGAAATCTTCPSPAAGIIDGAQQFGGGTNLSVPDDGTLDWGAAASFSVEFWMKTDPSSTCAGNQVIVGRDDPVSQLHWWVGCWGGTGVAAFRLRDKTDGPAGAVLGTRDLTDGNWHHVAAVRDGATGTSKLYVDGQMEGSQTYAYTSGFDSAAALNIGWMNLDSGFHFSGSIDEVALYQRAISEVEVRSHYYLARGYCEMCTGPVKIMPLGDSITKGNSDTVTSNDLMVSYRQKLYGDLWDLGYNVDLVGGIQSGGSAVPAFDIDHEGHNGFYASQVEAGVYGWLEASPPDLVLLHIGTNDISAGHSISSIVADVGAILDEIDRYNGDITVVLARIISRTDDKAAQTTALNDALAAMAEGRIAAGDKIIIVDQEHALDYPGDMDGVLHPAATGYQKMANVWLNSLVNVMPCCAGQIAPQIISTPVAQATVGQPYSYDVNASGNPVPSYSLLSGPETMTINQLTGLIQWTPGTAGVFNVEVQASNAAGSDVQVFAINVNEVADCPSGMLHYWPLDEASGPPYDDYFGNSNATCSTCPSPVDGTVGGAQQFEASTHVFVPDDGTLDWGTEASFTVEFWMKTDPANTCAGNQVFVGRDDPATQLHWWVGCWSGTGVAAFRLRDKVGGPSDAVLGTRDLTDGNWHHIVAVRDGASGTSTIYVDGQLEGSQTYTYSSGFDSGTALNIGWLNLDSQFHFSGTLDEVAIYQRALSEAEVQQHFSNGSYTIGYCDPPSSPSITSSPLTVAIEGQPYTYDVNATGNPAPTYSLVTAPAGMAIDSTTGLIQWSTPAAGNHDVTVRASNGVGSPANQSFSIDVTSPPSCTNGPVWLGGSDYHPSIQSAYQSISQYTTFMITGGEMPETIDFNRVGIDVELKGGFDCNFAVRNGNTTVLKVTISSGTVIIDGLTIR